MSAELLLLQLPLCTYFCLFKNEKGQGKDTIKKIGKKERERQVKGIWGQDFSVYGAEFRGEADALLDAEFETLSRKCQLLSKWQSSSSGLQGWQEVLQEESKPIPACRACRSRRCWCPVPANPPPTAPQGRRDPCIYLSHFLPAEPQGWICSHFESLEDEFVHILKMKSSEVLRYQPRGLMQKAESIWTVERKYIYGNISLARGCFFPPFFDVWPQ